MASNCVCGRFGLRSFQCCNKSQLLTQNTQHGEANFLETTQNVDVNANSSSNLNAIAIEMANSESATCPFLSLSLACLLVSRQRFAKQSRNVVEYDEWWRRSNEVAANRWSQPASSSLESRINHKFPLLFKWSIVSKAVLLSKLFHQRNQTLLSHTSIWGMEAACKEAIERRTSHPSSHP